MNAFMIASVALLAGIVPLLSVVMLRRPIDGFVALQLTGTLGVLTLLCLAEGFRRSYEFGVAVIGAFLTWAGGLLLARFLGRWL